MDHPSPPSTTRPAWVRLLAWLAVVLIAVALLLAPLPGYVLRPGPTFGLAERITLPGAPPLNGDYLFTTIQLDDATVARALGASFDPAAQVVTRGSILGEQAEADFIAGQLALFEATEQQAVGLALDAVGSDIDPATVMISDDGVGGPSAGLLIALAVADMAGGGDLAAGRLVSGTGAVDEDGSITPVGSIADKIAAAEAAGATVFLVPTQQVQEARRTGTDMAVIGVATLTEALSALSGG